MAPTPGELVVIGVRAQALADELRNAKTMAWIASLNPVNPPARCSPFWIDGPDLSWATQRLRSSIERALGTRQRLYDAHREQQQARREAWDAYPEGTWEVES